LTSLDFLIYNVIKILYYAMNRSISNNYIYKRAVVRHNRKIIDQRC